jgi:hypothetical protein
MARFASFWYGDSLSGYETLCIRSFLDFGHEYCLFTYNEDLNVPPGCKKRDASAVFDRKKIFFYTGENVRGRVSAFSNMFRYKMIHDTGLCWVDTDVLCLSEGIQDNAYIFARQDEEFYNGAVLQFPKGHEAMKLAAEYCWEVRDTAGWGDLGPRLVTRIVSEYDLESEAWATRKIYPIHWRETAKLVRPQDAEEVAARVEGSFFLHLWNEMFARQGICKGEAPPEGSFLAQAMHKHSVEQCFKRSSHIH